jgi:DNA-binding response OmpR family regulator
VLRGKRLMAKKILVVDDEQSIRALLNDILSAEGYEVQDASNGKEAIEKIAKIVPDLIITDLQMPVMDGLELIKTVRAEQPDILFLVITGYATVDSAIQALQLGAINYITKPFKMEDLLGIVRKGLRINELKQVTMETLPYMEHSLRFNIPSQIKLIQGIIQKVIQSLVSMGYDPNESQNTIPLILNEAITNAIRHGNKGDDKKSVDINAFINNNGYSITVRDEGHGFNPETIPDPTEPENLLKTSGRGIFLIRCKVDNVEFNPKGNEMIMFKARDPEADSQ